MCDADVLRMHIPINKYHRECFSWVACGSMQLVWSSQCVIVQWLPVIMLACMLLDHQWPCGLCCAV